MSDEPTERNDAQVSADQESGDVPAGYEAPHVVPTQGSRVPAPPLYDQNPYGRDLYGAGQYNQPGAYSQPGDEYATSYAPPAAPYGQTSGMYGQPPSPYGQQSPYGQPAYGQAGYYGTQAGPQGLSIASMVCGIASVILGWFLLPQVAAIITGHLALRREPSGKGMSITGLVLGYLCLLGYGAFWLFVIVGLAMYRRSGYVY